MHISITGGTGFVGRRLVASLLQQQHTVLVLTRNLERARSILGSPQGLELVEYDPLQPQSWASRLEGSQGIVNLAGEPLAGSRWTPAKKAEIRRSRIEGTQALVQAIQRLEQKPSVMVSGSAVGFYGPHEDDQSLTEASEAGSDFLAQVCVDWEAAAQPVQDLGVRLVILRTGIVLGEGGGALDQMVGPFQIFVGGPIGSGQQWLSWIHVEDLVKLIEFALTHASVEGVINGTAPQPLQMEKFCQTLGQVLGRPSWLPVPSLALELLLGEAAQVVLTGQRVIPAQAEAAGFSFAYPELKPALQDILIQ
jgi:hypothetical protein